MQGGAAGTSYSSPHIFAHVALLFVRLSVCVCVCCVGEQLRRPCVCVLLRVLHHFDHRVRDQLPFNAQKEQKWISLSISYNLRMPRL
jgi:hypothetical protein